MLLTGIRDYLAQPTQGASLILHPRDHHAMNPVGGSDLLFPLLSMHWAGTGVLTSSRAP